MNAELKSAFDALIKSWCDRRALKALHQFLPGYLAINGLTDGWETCVESLKDVRAICKDDLTSEEKSSLQTAIVIIDQMLMQR